MITMSLELYMKVGKIKHDLTKQYYTLIKGTFKERN